MSKYILVTDTHLGSHKSSDMRHRIAMELFNKIIQTAEKRGVSKLIHLGDMFDNRKHTTHKTLDVAHKIGSLLNLKFKESYFIIGNHDTYYKNVMHPTSLQIFSEFENITVVGTEESEWMTLEGQNIVLLPWLVDEENFSVLPDDITVFGHFEVTGANMNDGGGVAKNGMNASSFKRFKQVYSGHFHSISDYGNIKYIGAPYHMSFNDSAEKRGFYIWDSEDDSLEFIAFDSPKYVTLYAHEEIKEESVRGNMVRLIFVENLPYSSINKITEQVNSYEPIQLFVQMKTEDGFTGDKQEETLESVKNNKELLIDFIDKSETPLHLKDTILKRMVSELYDEVE